MLKKVVILGVESTGKTVLADYLAKVYHTDYCPEYARDYLTQHGKSYDWDDLCKIAYGQMALEQAFEKKALSEQQSILFYDTNLYVIKVWFEYVFNRCPYFVLDYLATTHFDFYFLPSMELPWVSDEFREAPDEAYRQVLFATYKDILVQQHTDWAIIKGQGNRRLQHAVDICDALLR